MVLRTMVQSVQLQHFNRNEVVGSDYLQLTLEHSDFIDHVYSSRSVAYDNFRMINISYDRSIRLMISRTTEEVPRGMGR